jgi:hypothetical protein
MAVAEPAEAAEEPGREQARSYSLMLRGGVWPFRLELEAAGVHGGYVEHPCGKEYARVMSHVTLGDQDRARVEDLLLGGPLQRTPVLLDDQTDRPGDEMVAWLQTLDSVYFR